ncbi:LAQU0S04e08218g1_1 [Lachancea quebecensis]|uniref:Kinase n=1 Tax=Lachancea quebecensis TaxID=1654605 RepID=A0A0P1KQX7_9SACH|nr:LAQU0S04e08218g1_1 [Lachancea quebecensis]
MSGSYRKAKHQAAGHDGNFTDAEESLFFKPTTVQEVEFYQQIQCRDAERTSTDLKLEAWMPVFLGTLEAGVTGKARESSDSEVQSAIAAHTNLIQNEPGPSPHNKPIIVLENLLHGYKSPNILDVKLGKTLYDDSASDDKKLRLRKVSQETTSGSLGLRICGMKLQESAAASTLDEGHYAREDDGYISINKFYGRGLDASNVKSGFELFFGSNSLSVHRRKTLTETFLHRIQLLYNTLLEEEVRMISASLLLVYEADSDRWDELQDRDALLRTDFFQDSSDDEEEVEHPSPLSSLSVIDFAHSRVTTGQGYDENVICGVESLIEIFDQLCSSFN